ncbi:SH3 domain-containing protein [Nocardiopsis dassonvillei]|uniref:SH3 domain-containing protein n=1 Tax=Nocardiopsis dassonvillei TaxID=2014 RepID=UPI003403B2B6
MRSVLVAALVALMAAGPLTMPGPASAATGHTTQDYTVIPVPGTQVIVRALPRNTSPQVSFLTWSGIDQAECWGHYQQITYLGYTSDVWFRVRLNSGGIGWVSALAVGEGERTVFPIPRC